MRPRQYLRRSLNKILALRRVLTDRWLAPFLAEWQGVDGAHQARYVGLIAIRKHEGSRIKLGLGVKLVSRPMSNPLRINQCCSFSTLTSDAFIEIGDGSALSGIVICAASGVRVGRRVMVGSNCVIVDTDFHPLDPDMRRSHPTAGACSRPVTIGDDVFIGTRVVILKGANIGEGCVVGAGAIVSGSFPPRSIIVGNPARILKMLDEISHVPTT